MRALALAALFSVAIATACSSPGSDEGSSGAALESAAGPLAISEIAIMQTLKVSLVRNGAAVARTLPVVAGRDALLRVYADPAGASPQAVTATLQLTGPDGVAFPALTDVKTLSAASTDATGNSTFNFFVPGSSLPVGVKYSVTLALAGQQPFARFPAAGQTAAMGLNAPEQLKVVLVPVKYMADGSGRLPDTSPEQIERYRRTLYAMYPVANIDLTVRAPVSFSTAITASGGGFGTLLRSMVQLRAQDGASLDTYYYGAFMPKATYSEYCASGCTTGLSGVLTNPSNTQRASVGVGFTGDSAARTMAHEIGHAHGRRHSPCGGAAGADPSFPNPGGGIGTWGYDNIRHVLLDPARAKDVMSYCEPRWPSDYTYAALFSRITRVNEAAGVDDNRPKRAFRIFDLAADGTLSRGERIELPDAQEGEEERAVTYEDSTGNVIARSTAHITRYDHLDGGYLLVPEESDYCARISVDGYGYAPWN